MNGNENELKQDWCVGFFVLVALLGIIACACAYALPTVADWLVQVIHILVRM